MLRTDSPVSIDSTTSSATTQSSSASVRNDNAKSTYRLFPTIAPTPPETPIQTRVRSLSRTLIEPIRKRSTSFDDSVRLAALRQNVPVKTVSIGRGRKVSVTEAMPMSTVQEQCGDSPTVPTGSTVFSWNDPTNRSNSAAGDYARNFETPAAVPSPLSVLNSKSAWASKQASSHPLASESVQGLGLSLFPPVDPHQQQSNRRGRTKPKPNLRIKVKPEEDRPPPPPPKSPRHSRSSSVRSAVSSLHEDSPPRSTLATPGSIMKAALVDSPVRTPPALSAVQQSYFPPAGDVRVRQVAPNRDAHQRTDSPLSNPSTQDVRKKLVGYPPTPNMDKPMPSLPTTSSKFSDHIREVREAENNGELTPRAIKSRVDSPGSAPSEAGSAKKVESLGRSGKRSPGIHISQLLSPKHANDSSIRLPRIPTPDLHSPLDIPTNALPTTPVGTKTLPTLPSEPGPRSTTPETTSRFPKSDQNAPIVDPTQTLRDLAKQCEALHARYSSLRSDRLKLSTSISASLKDSKPGSDYANGLLDQHLSLNAISSSMDICFAKLKSLDCRKEEAIAALVALSKTKVAESDAKSYLSVKSPLIAASFRGSGSSTPDIVEPKVLTPEIQQLPKFVTTAPPADPAPVPTPVLKDEMDLNAKPKEAESKATDESDKRITIVHTTLSPTLHSPSAISPEPPVSPISSIGIEHYTMPKRIRIKGAKAAKILGLVSASVNGMSPNAGITLPDAPSSKDKQAINPKEIAVELQIRPRKANVAKPSPQHSDVTSPAAISPEATSPACPNRAPPPPPPPRRKGTEDSVASSTTSTKPKRKDTEDSVASIAASSQSESSPEVTTPQGSPEMASPGGLKDMPRQTIQVFVDDDILDYYKSGR